MNHDGILFYKFLFRILMLSYISKAQVVFSILLSFPSYNSVVHFKETKLDQNVNAHTTLEER